MSELVRQSVSRAVFPFSYLNQIIRPGIRILMYHRIADCSRYDQLTVTPRMFDLQMQYLSQNYNLISLDAAFDALFLKHKNSNDIVITFDDGYLDNLENAVPILEKYEIPATIFITTEFCDQIKSHPRYSDVNKRLHLDWDEVNYLNKQPNITIGSHTISHPYLSRMKNTVSEKEIKESKKIIEKNLNSTIEHFCYPSGDFGNREVDFIKDAGYKTAVTVGPGKNRSTISPFDMHRTEVTQKDNEADLYFKLHGSFDLMHQILHWKRMRMFKKMSFNNTSK